ncbi:MAG: bifunctional diaminohydroxyphosphoribosylaminopyrimidine deaminase/5-amino-6-(5-phosphoribosylamino)uracil reductase RibD [Alphaproteobacteria bacterium]|nr:bifunctional diaminohydroxyphosphoribosylaminopyrimidine deaminase/5-amino-6-(5-phosphoribosylamino)uracil reductase RibD [Alphaproteobacteria bacterium]
MQAALGLARRALGDVAPNPAVGCVLVRAGRVVGRGWTQPGGRPHAETEALARAGEAARGATAYLSLEPCAHEGKTPPCVDALIEAGIGRAVVAVEDPDPRVAGKGIARLAGAGVKLGLGVAAEAAADLNAGFFLRIREGRPLVTLKTATTLDGRIATREGESEWITGERARQLSHYFRATHDAILVGAGTVGVDNPMLTCRLDGFESRKPVRIVVDSRLRLPLTSKLVATAGQIPTWVVAREDVDGERLHAFEDCGVEVLGMPPDKNGYPDIGEMMQEFGRRGLTRVLLEGGGHLAAALFAHGLIDRIAWFRAPAVMGGDGIPAATAFGVDRLADMPTFVRRETRTVGGDQLEIYVRRQ